MKIVVEDYLNEMATVFTGENKENASIIVTPDAGRVGDPYFKFLNNKSYTVADKVIRIKFGSVDYVRHKDSKTLWDLNATDRKLLVSILDRESTHYDATNWEVAKFLWNVEVLHLQIKLSKYLKGEYDETYKDNPSYVPNSLERPDYKILRV